MELAWATMTFFRLVVLRQQQTTLMLAPHNPPLLYLINPVRIKYVSPNWSCSKGYLQQVTHNIFTKPLFKRSELLLSSHLQKWWILGCVSGQCALFCATTGKLQKSQSVFPAKHTKSLVCYDTKCEFIKY